MDSASNMNRTDIVDKVFLNNDYRKQVQTVAHSI